MWVFPAKWAHANGLEMVALHAGFVVFEVVVLIYISIALARETHDQAELVVTQQHDHDLMLTLAQGLQSRDLSIGELVGGDEDAGSAIGTLRQGIGHVAELVQAIERTASGVASSSLEMAQTTVEAGRGQRPEVAGRSPSWPRAPSARCTLGQRRSGVRRAGRRRRRLERRERTSHR